jgi:hypothetical protein
MKDISWVILRKEGIILVPNKNFNQDDIIEEFDTLQEALPALKFYREFLPVKKPSFLFSEGVNHN